MTENFKLVSVAQAPRTELHDQLGLTGCEVSINSLPAGAAVPFVHAHKQNEELYGVLSGSGEIWIDGEVHAIKAGEWFRVSPAGKRAIRAAENEGITFICMQTKADSLENPEPVPSGFRKWSSGLFDNRLQWRPAECPNHFSLTARRRHKPSSDLA